MYGLTEELISKLTNYYVEAALALDWDEEELENKLDSLYEKDAKDLYEEAKDKLLITPNFDIQWNIKERFG